MIYSINILFILMYLRYLLIELPEKSTSTQILHELDNINIRIFIRAGEQEKNKNQDISKKLKYNVFFAR